MSRRLLRLLPALLLTGITVAAPAAAQGSFARTGDTAVGRNFCQATLLDDGRVLVTGGTRTGSNGSVVNREAELYDPKTGTFSPTGPMSVPRLFHAAVRLNDGRVLILGGETEGNVTLASAEIYDPKTGTFTR